MGQYWVIIPEIPKIHTPDHPVIKQNFIDSVKSRQQPESKLDYARQNDTSECIWQWISYKLQKPVKWNSKKGAFKKDGRSQWTSLETLSG